MINKEDIITKNYKKIKREFVKYGFSEDFIEKLL